MIRKFTQLVSETIDEGFERGIQLFMENLEIDLAKSTVINEAGGIDNVLEAMFESKEDATDDEPSDEEIDKLLSDLKKEGVID